MRIEKKLNEEIWPHFLKALDKTSIDKYGVINRNLSCAMAIKSENTILEKFQIEVKLWISQYLNLNLKGEPLDLFGGLCDLAFSFWKTNQSCNMYEVESKVIDEIILMKLKKNIAEMKRRIDDMEEADFDVISGLSGIAHYCFLKEDMYHEILQEIIKLFIQKTNSSSGWKIKNANLDMTYRKKFPNGYFNFGMSHGMLGPLIVMYKAFNKGYQVNGLRESIQCLLEKYGKVLDYETKKLPCIVDAKDENQKLFYERDSWSYGTSIIFYSLMQAAKAIRCDNLYHLYKDVLLRKIFFNNKLEKYNFISPTIVNGYGGMLCLLKEFYKMENSEQILREIENLEEHLMNMYDEKSTFGFRHYEYRYNNNEWFVEGYNLEGFSYGALGVISAIQGDDDIMRYHLFF